VCPDLPQAGPSRWGVTRKKRARRVPVDPRSPRCSATTGSLLKDQAPGLAKGLMFPSTVGRTDAEQLMRRGEVPDDGRWEAVHDPRLRYTLRLVRLANVDAVVRRR